MTFSEIKAGVAAGAEETKGFICGAFGCVTAQIGLLFYWLALEPFSEPDPRASGTTWGLVMAIGMSLWVAVLGWFDHRKKATR